MKTIKRKEHHMLLYKMGIVEKKKIIGLRKLCFKTY